jgi:nitrate/TMAO reductase-like tetraheme cytochrome c subunit
MAKITKYYLNGKEVTHQVIFKRKAKFKSSQTVEHKYYTAELTEEEKKKEKRISAANDAYFKRLRDYREDQEKFH